MEFFAFGIIVGYLLFPLTDLIGSYLAKYWDSLADRIKTAPGCTGNCNQGRCLCDCKGNTNGVS